ncbi:MAG: hypothetical protein V7642_3098 [Burkholderiales bacterium]|jgi:hypothetical protein
MTHLMSQSFLRYRLWTFSITMFVSIALWVCCANTHAQTSRANGADVLLQDLINLDDHQLQGRIESDWAEIRATLDRSLPPGQVAAPRPHGFAGPQQACLQSRTAAACRIYMRDLVVINKQKEQQGGSLLLNPWAATPR